MTKERLLKWVLAFKQEAQHRTDIGVGNILVQPHKDLAVFLSKCSELCEAKVDHNGNVDIGTGRLTAADVLSYLGIALIPEEEIKE